MDTASLSSSSIDVIPFCSFVVVDATLWHSRLRHPSYAKIDLLNNVLGLHKRNKEDFTHCGTCQFAKQKHLPFVSHNNMSDNAFKLIHIDTCGLFSVSTVEGYGYFLTIVDDHTRATWVYLMKTKDEVLHIFPSFLQLVETQYNTKVKSVRSYNAPELKFVDLFKKKGIISYHSCSEIPEQKSVIEKTSTYPKCCKSLDVSVTCST